MTHDLFTSTFERDAIRLVDGIWSAMDRLFRQSGWPPSTYNLFLFDRVRNLAVQQALGSYPVMNCSPRGRFYSEHISHGFQYTISYSRIFSSNIDEMRLVVEYKFEDVRQFVSRQMRRTSSPRRRPSTIVGWLEGPAGVVWRR